MKKLFAIFSSFIMIFSAMFLYACGCSSTVMLTFNNNFAEGKEVSGGYKETLTYSVDYVKDEPGYKTDEKIFNGDVIKIEYETGTAVTTLEVLNSFPSAIKSDLDELMGESGVKVYKYTNSLRIPITITLDGKTYSETEKVDTEAYFFSSNLSFSPIYSRENSEYFIVAAGSSSANATRLKTSVETKYNRKDYTVSVNSKYFDIGEEVTEFSGQPNVQTYNYDFRTAVDNAQLGFITRGLTVDEKNGATVPVISFRYQKPQTLSFSTSSSSITLFNLKYNGKEYDRVTFNYNEISYRINSFNASGTPQKICVQTKATDDIKNLALPVMYIEPLQSMSSGYAFYGCLKYTLKEIETANA